MSEHLTIIRGVDDKLLVHCPEHGPVVMPRQNSRQGFNAAITEARYHDDQMHGVKRTDKQYREALGSLR